MSILNPEYKPDEMHAPYKAAHPFPHVVVDNFLDDWVADRVAQELEKTIPFGWKHEDHVGQYLKYWADNPDILPQSTGFLLRYLNSPFVLEYMSKLTGIKDLIADPTYEGGGVHMSQRGGRLDIHCDFNLHPKFKYHRRINLLIYFNRNWHYDWAGQLELWERDMSKCCLKVSPVFNRAVIFTITDDAYHGVPDPLLCPFYRKRFSIAMYYYTLDRPEEEKAPAHMALWKPTRAKK